MLHKETILGMRRIWLFLRIVGRYDFSGMSRLSAKTAWKVASIVHPSKAMTNHQEAKREGWSGWRGA